MLALLYGSLTAVPNLYIIFNKFLAHGSVQINIVIGTNNQFKFFQFA